MKLLLVLMFLAVPLNAETVCDYCKKTGTLGEVTVEFYKGYGKSQGRIFRVHRKCGKKLLELIEFIVDNQVKLPKGVEK